MAHKTASWIALDGLQADVALLQEAHKPVGNWVPATGAEAADTWETALHGGLGSWRTAVVALSGRVELRRLHPVALETSKSYDDFVVSRAGSIAAAEVVVD